MYAYVLHMYLVCTDGQTF